MSGRVYRIGQIVPSSNTTMESEISAILRGRETIRPDERFTFHSSRMRMKKVTKEELAAMDADSDRCALELSDARVDVMGYACLVAIMSMGPGYHRHSQQRLHRRTIENGAPAPVVTSAGALIDGLKVMGARKIAVITPYMKPLTDVAVNYINVESTITSRLGASTPWRSSISPRISTYRTPTRSSSPPVCKCRRSLRSRRSRTRSASPSFLPLCAPPIACLRRSVSSLSLPMPVHSWMGPIFSGLLSRALCDP